MDNYVLYTNDAVLSVVIGEFNLSIPISNISLFKIALVTFYLQNGHYSLANTESLKHYSHKLCLHGSSMAHVLSWS